MKKLIAILLVVAMSLCLLAGCGSSNTTEKADNAAEKIEVYLLIKARGDLS